MFLLISKKYLFLSVPKKKKEKIKINRIKAVLAEKDMQQKELAAKVGVLPNSITRICNNVSQPSLKMLRDIALVLDVDIRELLVPTK
jgi:putative transcriptional regulator